jgi:hypothetical protein
MALVGGTHSWNDKLTWLLAAILAQCLANIARIRALGIG